MVNSLHFFYTISKLEPFSCLLTTRWCCLYLSVYLRVKLIGTGAHRDPYCFDRGAIARIKFGLYSLLNFEELWMETKLIDVFL